VTTSTHEVPPTKISNVKIDLSGGASRSGIKFEGIFTIMADMHGDYEEGRRALHRLIESSPETKAERDRLKKALAPFYEWIIRPVGSIHASVRDSEWKEVIELMKPKIAPEAEG